MTRTLLPHEEQEWWCTYCGQRAVPSSQLTLIDQAGRYARGRHCRGVRDLVLDPDEAQRLAATVKWRVKR